MNRIVVLPGDGIGPEVTREAQRVLELVSERHNLKLSFDKALIGGCLSLRSLILTNTGHSFLINIFYSYISL